LRVVCEAAIEQINHGKSTDQITPFWRILDPKNKIVAKLPIGSEKFIQDMREAERQN
jgi:hypothetical protein